MMRNAVKEKCGYMMLIIMVGFMLIQTYTGHMEQDLEEDIIFGLSENKRDKINQMIAADASENEIEIGPPNENEYIKNLDKKIDEEINLSEHMQYVPALEIIRRPKLTRPQDIGHQENFIDVGMILINLQKTKRFDPQLEWKITRTFDSMVTYSSGTPLHFIVITNKESKDTVGMFFSHFISKRTSEGAIVQTSWRKKRLKGVPVIKISFVDLNSIKQIDEQFIRALKLNTQEKDDETIDKYSSDLFYIGPLYHRAFVKLDRLIFIDTTDIHFFEDIKVLDDQFDKIGDEIMGVGLDLSPHYRKFLVDYLVRHPDTPLGLPGKQQGFNTGVVLYRLDNMRKSKLYNSYITPEKVTELTRLYMYNMTLGDQDWFTNLGFSHPELFYILPCQLNTQLSIQYLQPPWESVFDKYHYCDVKKNQKIIHRNGCGPMPQQCGYTPPPDSEYWKGKSYITDMYMDIEALWEIMRDVHLGITKFHLFQARDS